MQTIGALLGLLSLLAVGGEQQPGHSTASRTPSTDTEEIDQDVSWVRLDACSAAEAALRGTELAFPPEDCLRDDTPVELEKVWLPSDEVLESIVSLFEEAGIPHTRAMHFTASIAAAVGEQGGSEAQMLRGATIVAESYADGWLSAGRLKELERHVPGSTDAMAVGAAVTLNELHTALKKADLRAEQSFAQIFEVLRQKYVSSHSSAVYRAHMHR